MNNPRPYTGETVLVREDLRRLSVVVPLDPDVPEDMRRDHALAIMTHELMAKLHEYEKIIFAKTKTRNGFVEYATLCLDIIVPRTPL